MAHWGWYWKVKKKHASRVLCSKLTSIDSFKIFKSSPSNGFTVQPLEIKAVVNGDSLQITYCNRKQTAYQIPIDKLPCNYGGFRYYFRCPLCAKRMRILYLTSQSAFLCRMCLNLAYESQQLRPTRRYWHMSDKIKSFAKHKGGDFEMYQKPPRMHAAHFQKIRSKQFYYESKSRQAANKELRKWYGPRIERHLDTFFDYVDETKNWRTK
jgi:hypothetical protein